MFSSHGTNINGMFRIHGKCTSPVDLENCFQLCTSTKTFIFVFDAAILIFVKSFYVFSELVWGLMYMFTAQSTIRDGKQIDKTKDIPFSVLSQW